MYESEVKKIKARIQRIQEYERYMFQNLSFSENFPETCMHYEEQKGKILQYIRDIGKLSIDLKDLEQKTEGQIEITAEGLKLKVKKDDVCQKLSLEKDVISMTGRKLLINTDNFKVNETEAYFDGTVIATSGEIGGWKIEGNKLVGQKLKSGEYSSIWGGTVYADQATTYLVDVSELDFNPNYEDEIHTIDLRNADISTSIDIDEDTAFGDLTIHGPVTLEGENSLECGMLYCTALDARGSSKYITIFCDEIITETESFSDRRLKKDIREIRREEAEAFLRKLRPVKYRYRKTGMPGTGLIAQEVKPVAEAFGYKSMVEEKKGYLGIGYRQLIPLMIRQINTNMERIEVLKNGRNREERSEEGIFESSD